MKKREKKKFKVLPGLVFETHLNKDNKFFGKSLVPPVATKRKINL